MGFEIEQEYSKIKKNLINQSTKIARDKLFFQWKKYFLHAKY